MAKLGKHHDRKNRKLYKSVKAAGRMTKHVAKAVDRVDLEKVGKVAEKVGKAEVVIGAGITAVAPEAGVGEALMASGAATQAVGKAVGTAGRAKQKVKDGKYIGAVKEIQKGVKQAKKDKKAYDKKYA